MYEHFLLKGNEARKKKNFHQAFEFFDRAIQILPQTTEAYNEKGTDFCLILNETIKLNF